MIGAANPLTITLNGVIVAEPQPLVALTSTVVVPLLNKYPLPVPEPLAIVAPVNVYV